MKKNEICALGIWLLFMIWILVVVTTFVGCK